MDIGELEAKLREAGIPFNGVLTDDYGEIVIYTGMMENDEGTLIDFEEE